jgi:hypothetical protein
MPVFFLQKQEVGGQGAGTHGQFDRSRAAVIQRDPRERKLQPKDESAADSLQIAQ